MESYLLGVDPSFPDHAKYLQQMNDDFEEEMTQRIDAAIAQREAISVQDPLLQECVQHLEFCQVKSQAYGRSEDLQVSSFIDLCNSPLIRNKKNYIVFNLNIFVICKFCNSHLMLIIFYSGCT